jgi:hypothetical protein
VSINFNSAVDQETKCLFKLIKEKDGKYFIDTEKNSEKLWLVVRAMKNDMNKISYEIKKSDIVKLGRIQFRVKDMQTPTIPKNDLENIILNEDIEEIRSIILKNEECHSEDENSNIPQ